jgi:hypothetical protein
VQTDRGSDAGLRRKANTQREGQQALELLLVEKAPIDGAAVIRYPSDGGLGGANALSPANNSKKRSATYLERDSDARARGVHSLTVSYDPNVNQFLDQLVKGKCRCLSKALGANFTGLEAGSYFNRGHLIS